MYSFVNTREIKMDSHRCFHPAVLLYVRLLSFQIFPPEESHGDERFTGWFHTDPLQLSGLAVT